MVGYEENEREWALARRLEKALRMEREIVGHLIVDDPHPQIWEELLEAHAYTDKLVRAIKGP